MTETRDGDADIPRLLAIMARLRDPDQGCPWDREQSFATIAPYTIEEAYEVADAIAKGDRGALRDELGDLLFQVVFHSRMAEEEGSFAFADVVRALCDKMVRRHPHVFAGDRNHDHAQGWERIKAAERAAKAPGAAAPSLLDDVPLALPALARAVKLQKRAARVGFDWPHAGHVLDKAAEEIEELRQEVQGGGSLARVAEEFGDLMFVYANLARHLDVDPEAALRDANAKFDRRFRRIEALLAAQGRGPEQSTLDEMEAFWQQAKREEKAAE